MIAAGRSRKSPRKSAREPALTRKKRFPTVRRVVGETPPAFAPARQPAWAGSRSLGARVSREAPAKRRRGGNPAAKLAPWQSQAGSAGSALGSGRGWPWEAAWSRSPDFAARRPQQVGGAVCEASADAVAPTASSASQPAQRAGAQQQVELPAIIASSRAIVRLVRHMGSVRKLAGEIRQVQRALHRNNAGESRPVCEPPSRRTLRRKMSAGQSGHLASSGHFGGRPDLPLPATDGIMGKDPTPHVGCKLAGRSVVECRIDGARPAPRGGSKRKPPGETGMRKWSG